MRKTFYFVACLGAVAVLKARADDLGLEIPAESGEAVPVRDTFATALAVINGEAGADSASGTLPEFVISFAPQGESTVPAAPLADGHVSSFRVGADGFDKVTVSESGGLSVGATAVDTHVIEITANGRITPGTYTLVDYEGAIGGAGFSGLVLRSALDLHAELVNNTAETKIELVVSDADEPERPDATDSIWSLGSPDNWLLFTQTGEVYLGDASAMADLGITSLLSPEALVFAKDVLQ